MRKAPFLILPPSRKRPLDTAGLRAHCAQQVENGQAAQVVESLLNLVESLAERCDRLELTLGRLAQAQWGRKSERISSAQLTLALPAIAELPALPPLEDSPAVTAPLPRLERTHLNHSSLGFACPPTLDREKPIIHSF